MAQGDESSSAGMGIEGEEGCRVGQERRGRARRYREGGERPARSQHD